MMSKGEVTKEASRETYGAFFPLTVMIDLFVT